MKYNILILSFLLLIISSNSAIGDNNYIINNATVYIDDSKVYLSANPHTLSSSGWVYFNLTSKVYTGNIDACWGFNTSVSKSTKAEIYSPYWINTTTNHQKIFYNPTHVVYTGDNLDYGNSYNTNYRYTITESIVNENGTTYITSNTSFDSYITDGTNYTIYWYTRLDNYYLWKDFSSSFNSIIHDYKGYNKWYYIKNIPIASNKEYTVRAWIDVLISTKKQIGKYYFAIKPSHETISQAITNGHFYNLDPWWNVTWSNRKNITLTGTGSQSFSNPIEDGDVNSSTKRTSSSYIFIGKSALGVHRGYSEWDISTIPSDAIITKAIFKYHGYSNTEDCIIKNINIQPSISSASNIYTAIGSGNIYADTTGFPEIGNDKQIVLNNNATSDIQSAISTDWFAIGFINKDESNVISKIYSEDYGSVIPAPTLYVEYTSVSEGGNDQTDYQLLLNVTYEPEMQSDFDDLRFTNDTYKLDSWLESKVDGSYALIWVEFPTTPANGVNLTYYIYYGNAEAVNDWDGDTTFSFFDDFPGVSLDADKWELVNTPDITVSGGILTIDNNAVSEYIRSKTYTTAYGKAIRTRERDYTASHYPGLFAFGERTSGTNVNHVSKAAYSSDLYMLVCNDGAGAEVTSSGNAVDDSYHLWDLTWLSDEVKLIKDGSQDEILTTEIPSTSLKIVLGGQTLGGSYYGNSQGSFDWVFVRKYVTNPPTYTFGSEETVSYMPPTPISLMNITGNFWVNHTWAAGSGNVTDSYNVSVNDVWHNTSPAYYNDTYAPHAWQNIKVYAFNTSSIGTLSTSSINQNTQIPNNPITITNTSDWTGDAGVIVYVDYNATDIDSDTATFSCDRTDLFTDFDTSTGTGNWTATANIYYVDFGVSDGYGSSSNYTMTLIESSVEITLLDELKLIMSEITTGLKSINMGNYLVYAFILIGILLIILLIQILNNCIYRG